MRIKTSLSAIFLAVLATFFIASQGFCGGAEGRPTISDAQRALAMMEVQNAFSKHAYYHINGNHCEEMEDIWAREDGAFGKTATWAGMEGITAIKEAYCINNIETKKKALTAISKVSDVEDVPENIGAGHEFSLHMQTTPIIEIAGDGKTAKGIWYTPGFIKRVVIEGKNVSTSGTWLFERYAVDFVKEDGKWKIWHLQNLLDTSPPWGDPANAVDMSGAPGSEYVWNPTNVTEMYPKFPEPYYTFSETFSY